MTEIKTSNSEVDILVLGAGWLAQFLLPLLYERRIRFCATTRDGRDVAGFKTVPFSLSSPGSFSVAGERSDNANVTDNSKETDWTKVPKARLILITFPITEPGAITRCVEGYEKVHGTEERRWLQLGSTAAWTGQDGLAALADAPITRDTPIPRPAPPRTESELELLALNSTSPVRLTSVLNLAGLWGGTRHPRNWVSRPTIAGSKEALAKKGSLHLIHGDDVATAIAAMYECEDEKFGGGERWLLSDMRVYDWWNLASAWGSGGLAKRGQPVEGEQPRWVLELMQEQSIPSLPRPTSALPGKHLSSVEFWRHFGLTPQKARIED